MSGNTERENRIVPRGLSLNYKKKEESTVTHSDKEIKEKTISLHEYELKIDWDKLPKALKDKLHIDNETLKFLEQYEPLNLKIWTDKKLPAEDYLQFLQRNDTNIILLAEGLISNHDQWKNPNVSFIHRLFNNLNENIPESIATNQNTEFVAIAISCPGFGGTPIKNKENTSIEQVSSESYAKILNIVSGLFNVTTAVGHSAGGEGVLKLSHGEYENKIPVVALEPAVGINKQTIFKHIKILEKIQDISRKLLGKHGKILINVIEDKFLRKLIGLPLGKLNKAQTAQLEVHKTEKGNNPRAYIAKLEELYQKDNVNLHIDSFSKKSGVPLLLLSAKDVLTKKKLADDWFKEMFSYFKKQLENSFELILPKSNINFAEEVSKYMNNTQQKGHDAVFFDIETQEIAIDLIVKQVEQSLMMRSKFHQEIAQSMRFISRSNFPLTLKLIPESNKLSLKAVFEQYRKAEKSELLLEHSLKDKETIKYQLEQIEIALRWQEVKQLIFNLNQTINNTSENKLEEIKTELKTIRNRIVQLMFNTNTIKLYMNKKGIHLNDDETYSPEQVGEHLLELFYVTHSERQTKPEIIPRILFTDESDRFEFRDSLAQILLNIESNFTTLDFLKESLSTHLRKINSIDFTDDFKQWHDNHQELPIIDVTIEDLITLSALSQG